MSKSIETAANGARGLEKDQTNEGFKVVRRDLNTPSSTFFFFFFFFLRSNVSCAHQKHVRYGYKKTWRVS